MPWFDLPLDQLRDYRTDTAEPPELDRWWQQRLEAARAAARPPALTRYEAGIYAPVEGYDTEFSGRTGPWRGIMAIVTCRSSATGGIRPLR